MKYIKKYNEDINWNNWIQEEENNFNFLFHIKNDIPIKINYKDWNIFIKDLKNELNINISNFYNYIIGHDYLYLYLYNYEPKYLSQSSIENYLRIKKYVYNIDKVVEYKK